MLQERVEGRWLSSFRRVFALNGIGKGTRIAILSETQSRPVLVHLAELAAQDPLTFEKDKIKGAVRTDFILSAEIVAITLGIVADAPLLNQVLVLSGIALAVTVGL